MTTDVPFVKKCRVLLEEISLQDKCSFTEDLNAFPAIPVIKNHRIKVLLGPKNNPFFPFGFQNYVN